MGCGSSNAATPPPEPAPVSAMKTPDSNKKDIAEDIAGGAPAKPPSGAATGAPKGRRGSTGGGKGRRRSMQAKEMKRRGSTGGLMAKLALKFPICKKSFDHVYDAFHSHAISSAGKRAKEQIHTKDLAEVMSKIGEQRQYTKSELDACFSGFNLNTKKTITFREYLTTVCKQVFLKEQSEDEGFLEVQRGFKILEQAFHEMDADNGGSVDSNELKKALFADGGQSQEDVIQKRFADLDFNDDGDIELPEFVYGMLSWVGFSEDED